jgi:hypothetical protein
MISNLVEDVKELRCHVLILDFNWHLFLKTIDEGFKHGLMDPDLIAVKVWNSDCKVSILTNMVSLFCYIKESSIEVKVQELAGAVQEWGLSHGHIQWVVLTGRECPEVSSI